MILCRLRRSSDDLDNGGDRDDHRGTADIDVDIINNNDRSRADHHDVGSHPQSGLAGQPRREVKNDDGEGTDANDHAQDHRGTNDVHDDCSDNDTSPPTTTTVPPRLVTFTFVNDEISATQWTDTQKTSSITDFVSVSSTDSVWVKSLPNGTTQFKFRMYRFRNPLGYYPTRFSNFVGATCVDDSVEDNSVGRVRPAFAPDLNSYVTVTCDATGTGPITVPLVYSHPTT